MRSHSSILCLTSVTICISHDYSVYSFGKSKYGSHGHKEEEINIPTQINNLNNIKMIDCGAHFTICLDYNGKVFSFGDNGYGQLGINKYEDELGYTHVLQPINIPPCKQVSCGTYFSICLTEDNKLYSFGHNNNGQLGLGNNIENYSSPQLIPDLNDIEFIVCNGDHSICKTYNNEFYSWGGNEYGQLGQENNNYYNKPVQCLNWPDNIIDIKCGDSHSLLLTSKGYVYSFGDNEFGQLGINDKNIAAINIPTLIKDIPEIQRIEAGDFHILCMDINNNIWAFGGNEYGQIGLGDKENRFKAILHPTLSNIIDISSRGFHTFVKTIDNKIYAFGYNEYSQLGIKTSKDKQLTPIQVLKGKENIWCSTIGKSKAKSARK